MSEDVRIQDRLRASGLMTLGTDPPPDAIPDALRRLRDAMGEVDRIGREALTTEAVKLLEPHGWTRTSVRDALKVPEPPKNEEKNAPVAPWLRDPEPWSDPVDGAELVTELEATFARFLALPEGAALTLALWVVHSHAHEAADVSPLLTLSSPTKRAGKTTALEILAGLVPRPLPAANLSLAVLFRAMDAGKPTLLLDEADQLGLNDWAEVVGVLNSGHTRTAAYVYRCDGDNNDVRSFRVWAPKCIALIGRLPQPLEDRSVVIGMKRRRQGEMVERSGATVFGQNSNRCGGRSPAGWLTTSMPFAASIRQCHRNCMTVPLTTGDRCWRLPRRSVEQRRTGRGPPPFS